MGMRCVVVGERDCGVEFCMIGDNCLVHRTHRMRFQQIVADALQFVGPSGGQHDFATGGVESVGQRFAQSGAGAGDDDHLFRQNADTIVWSSIFLCAEMVILPFRAAYHDCDSCGFGTERDRRGTERRWPATETRPTKRRCSKQERQVRRVSC